MNCYKARISIKRLLSQIGLNRKKPKTIVLHQSNSVCYLFRKSLFSTSVFLLTSVACFSQSPAAKDSTCLKDSVCKKDPLQFYRKIHHFAAKRRITYFLYGAVFRDPPVGNAIASNTSANGPTCSSGPGDHYTWVQGKVIRRIHLVTLDPMGQLIDDTIPVQGNLLVRAGNQLHVKSKPRIIRNKLLFKENDVIDSLKLIESERIIRTSTGIRDARISPQCPAIDNDSIDILIVVRDLWSINGDLQASTGKNTLRVGDNNFMGLSHLVQNRVSYTVNDPSSFTTSGNYIISNIRNTFVSANLYYTYSNPNKNIGLSLDRGFISPLTKWAGGINVNPVKTVWTSTLPGPAQNFPLEFRQEDVWLGRSFGILKGKSHAYNDPRIVLSGRVYDIHYFRHPDYKYDSLKKNQNSNLYLAGIGFCSRSYYKDVNIYRFGRTEDVPEGRLISFTGGYQKLELYDQFYYGIKLAAGNHIHKTGYLSEKLEYGTFLRSGNETKGVVNADINFLSDLLRYGKWSARAFIDLRHTRGLNRSPEESININGQNGLNGFSSDVLKGTTKTVLNLAAVFYSPFKVLEFQFAAILFAGFGRLSMASDTYKQEMKT
jgi:hypothetical protein